MSIAKADDVQDNRNETRVLATYRHPKTWQHLNQLPPDDLMDIVKRRFAVGDARGDENPAQSTQLNSSEGSDTNPDTPMPDAANSNLNGNTETDDTPMPDAANSNVNGNAETDQYTTTHKSWQRSQTTQMKLS